MRLLNKKVKQVFLSLYYIIVIYLIVAILLYMFIDRNEIKSNIKSYDNDVYNQLQSIAINNSEIIYTVILLISYTLLGAFILKYVISGEKNLISKFTIFRNFTNDLFNHEINLYANLTSAIFIILLFCYLPYIENLYELCIKLAGLFFSFFIPFNKFFIYFFSLKIIETLISVFFLSAIDYNLRFSNELNRIDVKIFNTEIQNCLRENNITNIYEIDDMRMTAASFNNLISNAIFVGNKLINNSKYHGVIFHEIGHIVHKHSMKSFYAETTVSISCIAFLLFLLYKSIKNTNYSEKLKKVIFITYFLSFNIFTYKICNILIKIYELQCEYEADNYAINKIGNGFFNSYYHIKKLSGYIDCIKVNNMMRILTDCHPNDWYRFDNMIKNIK